jgi:2,4-dichlorophenol 6-monooxygenase
VPADEPAADPARAAAEGARGGASPGRIRFGHELIDLEQDEDGVRALVRDNASAREYSVRCEYLLGADGGHRVPQLIGAEYEGLAW